MIRSPRVTRRRSIKVRSSAAPQTPSSSQARTSLSFCAGVSCGAPNKGQRSSTPLSSTSWRPPRVPRIDHRAHGHGLRDPAPRFPGRRAPFPPRGDGSGATDTSPPKSAWPWSCSPVMKASLRDCTPDDRGAAQHQAEEENAKARQPAAQFAPREFSAEAARLQIIASGIRPCRPPCAACAGSAAPGFLHGSPGKECAPRSAVEGEDQVGDACAGGAIEIAGGLVGEQDLRPRRQRARQRHALLFAARQSGPDNDRCAGSGRRCAVPASARSKASGTPVSSSGTATFSSAVMVGSDGSSGTRCRCAQPEACGGIFAHAG